LIIENKISVEMKRTRKQLLTRKEKEKKIRFIEILLTLGGLLGTALTISGAVQIWELSLVSLCLFILFSLFYYSFINYSSLKEAKKISAASLLIAIFFSVLFSNVLSKPITNSLTAAFQNIVQISPDLKIIFISVIALIIIFVYLFLTTYIIYRNLTIGIT